MKPARPPTDPDWTPCPWTRPGSSAKCGVRVPGIDPQRTCVECRKLGAPSRVDYEIVVGRPVTGQVSSLPNAALLDPKAEVGHWDQTRLEREKRKAAEEAAARFFKLGTTE